MMEEMIDVAVHVSNNNGFDSMELSEAVGMQNNRSSATSKAPTRINDEVARAWELYRTKKYEECENLCNTYSAAGKHNAGISALSGLLQQRRGKHPQAMNSFRAALALGPGAPWIHHALGVSAMAIQDMNTAVVHLRVAATNRQEIFDYQLKLGIALQEIGQHHAADESLKKALALNDNHAVIHFRLGIGAQHDRLFDEALQHYDKALQISPQYEAAYINKGTVLCEMGRYDEGLSALQRAMDLSPNRADTVLRRASALFSRGVIAEATRHAMKAVQLAPGMTDAHVLLGKLYSSQGKMDAADQCFRVALRMDPANAHIRIAQAVMLEKRGDIDAARTTVDSALKEIPNHPQLLLLFGRMAKTDHSRKEAIERIEKRLPEDPPLNKNAKTQLQFVLATLYDRFDEHDKAFANLQEANKHRHNTRPLDRSRTENEFESIRKAFTKEYLLNAPRSQLDGSQMVFIVGMPRSGTSLTEQIISAHPKAYGCGELTMLDRIVRRWPDGDDARPPVQYPIYIPDIDSAGLTEIAYRYFNRLPKGAAEHACITDKMPYNFMHIGIITLLFPKARFVHCMRNPMDNAFSCYLQDFLEGNSFSYSLEDCGWFYNQYRKLMDHWKQVLPEGTILDLHYEDTVSDQENTVRKLLDFCQLEWDPACLSFHNSKRVVHTASYQQVREPLYTRAVGRWKAYDKYLEPLSSELSMYPGDATREAL